jgi:DNA-binding transcriptional regulator YiaG
MTSFADRLSLLLLSTRTTHSEIAKQFSVSSVTVKNWEMGHTEPKYTIGVWVLNYLEEKSTKTLDCVK